jgi:type II secretory pathway pseudopilin PulG
MKILIKFIHQKSSQNQGFITLEILISLLIALGFVAVSMQSLVYAMAMKVQAQEKQRANQLIQEDLERLNKFGNDIDEDHDNKCSPDDYDNGYAANLWNSLQTEDSGAYSGDENTTSITTKLLKKISGGLTDDSGKTIGLRRIAINEIDPNTAISPYRNLKIRYEIWDWDGTNFVDDSGVAVDSSTTEDPIAETYVEVIPNVALACP